MKIRLTRAYLYAFAALVMLCGLGHEFVHHVAGALLCDSFGHKTFNSFKLATECSNRPLAFVVSTWAGPLFTFGLMWFGWRRLASADEGVRQLGMALIFANLPINRLLFALLGFNDEQHVTRTVIGDSITAYWLTNLAIWVLVLPPLVAAWRALSPRHRLRTFVGLFTLPFVFVVLVVGLVLENWLLLQHRVLADEIIGIPLLLFVAEALALVAWWRWREAIGGPQRPATAPAGLRGLVGRTGAGRADATPGTGR